MSARPFLLASAILPVLCQQNYSTPKERIKYIHALAKQGGSGAIAQLSPYLDDPDNSVRIETVKAVVEIGTPGSVDALLHALSDKDPDVQIRATDGLVNFYLPGYVQTGITAPIKRAGGAIKSRVAGASHDQMIPAYVTARDDVILGLGKVTASGATMEVRANAARGLGVLRGRAALPDLENALRARDTNVIYESLIAIQKINDPAASPSFVYLLHDLTDKVQIAALETTGLFRNQAALPEVRDVYGHPRDGKIKRAALNAIAQMPQPQDRQLLGQCLTDKDPDIRAAAAEGLGRLDDAADRQTVKTAFDAEAKPGPRMALAFAEVMLGDRDMSEFAPLRYLGNQLNSAAWRGVALAYLVELARLQEVRTALYPTLNRTATRDEKTGLAQVLAASGDRESIPYLDKLSRDRDPDVAREGLSALRSLKVRYPD